MSLALARKFLAAIEAGATGDALAAFYAADVVQEEFPNRLVPIIRQRNYDCFEPF
jgi:hypothetical protein